MSRVERKLPAAAKADAMRDYVLMLARTRMPLEDAVRLFRQAYIVAAVRASRGNQSNAARLIGVHRNTVERTLADIEKKCA